MSLRPKIRLPRFFSSEIAVCPIERSRIKLRASGKALKMCQDEVSAYSSCVFSKPHLKKDDCLAEFTALIHCHSHGTS